MECIRFFEAKKHFLGHSYELLSNTCCMSVRHRFKESVKTNNFFGTLVEIFRHLSYGCYTSVGILDTFNPIGVRAS